MCLRYQGSCLVLYEAGMCRLLYGRLCPRQWNVFLQYELMHGWDDLGVRVARGFGRHSEGMDKVWMMECELCTQVLLAHWYVPQTDSCFNFWTAVQDLYVCRMIAVEYRGQYVSRSGFWLNHLQSMYALNPWLHEA